MSSAAVGPFWLARIHSQHLCAVCLSTVPSFLPPVFLFLSCLFFLTSFFPLLCLFSQSSFPPFFLSLSRSLLLLLSLWADSPSALILLCTVLLQMRQARRLSNPCIQRYTSRIGECSSTYVSSSKSPLLNYKFTFFNNCFPLTGWPLVVVDVMRADQIWRHIWCSFFFQRTNHILSMAVITQQALLPSRPRPRCFSHPLLLLFCFSSSAQSLSPFHSVCWSDYPQLNL